MSRSGRIVSPGCIRGFNLGALVQLFVVMLTLLVMGGESRILRLGRNCFQNENVFCQLAFRMVRFSPTPVAFLARLLADTHECYQLNDLVTDENESASGVSFAFVNSL